MSEKLIPVRAESELRVGMIVVYKACRRCSRAHRGMLLKSVHTGCIVEAGSHRLWDISPFPSCRDMGASVLCLIHSALIDGRLFRVDDEMDTQALNRLRKELVDAPPGR